MSSTLMLKAKMVHEEGFLTHYKREFANAHGAVTISKIGMECVGVLVLIVVLILIPNIGAAITAAMPKMADKSPWAGHEGDAAGLWSSVSPIVTVCVLVCLVGLVLKVIFDLRQTRN